MGNESGLPTQNLHGTKGEKVALGAHWLAHTVGCPQSPKAVGPDWASPPLGQCHKVRVLPHFRKYGPA